MVFEEHDKVAFNAIKNSGATKIGINFLKSFI
jgi:hypothetical protein